MKSVIAPSFPSVTIFIVKFLVSKGLPIDECDDYGFTPLLLAAKHGHANIVEFLISKGANIDVKDKYYNKTPMIFACENHYDDITDLLKKHDSNKQ